jgi:uncharacterized membrane protein YdfJ with MMPL/SSD domain
MNFLSLSASYGATVWIFQDGHLARWLGFTPGPTESGTPLIMFCVAFGLSMDYGVLLLSRIQEEYRLVGEAPRRLLRAESGDSACDPVAQSGRTFWFMRKKFVGSYFRLSATRRS